MSTLTTCALPLAGIAATVTFVAGSALAATGPPAHTSDPAVWGPDVASLCDDPAAAAAAGYNVIEDEHPDAEGHFGGLLEGTDGADAIYALGGNDIVHAGGGDDVVCGSFGNDDLFGDAGNDALIGQGHADDLRGGANSDFLDGGGQHDRCDGGNGDDAAAATCEEINA